MKNSKLIALIVATLGIGLGLGWLLRGPHTEEPHVHSPGDAQTYTCSMHPQVRRTEPGDCPICGMDLVPAGQQNSYITPFVEMTGEAMKLANVQTEIIGTGRLEATLTLTGQVTEDERSVFTQTAHIPGRIEKLAVNYTGQYVKKGQIIARIYSPELVVAQQELLEARSLRNSQPEIFLAARQKLLNLKLSAYQVKRILEQGEPTTTFPIVAERSGYVTEEFVEQGDYITNGQPVFTIADLSRVWVRLDLYEHQLSQVSKGDSLYFTTDAVPGKSFRGKISYIDPVIDGKSRVAGARVEIRNPELRLKPGMFVSGTVQTGSSNTQMLTIPASALLWTGTRSLVYVKTNTAGKNTFVAREVTVTDRTGNRYLVTEGLSPGQEIVVNGTFTVDAAAQLAGKTSMMNQPVQTGSAETPSATPEPFLLQYLALKDALARDDEKNAATSFKSLQEEISRLKARAANSKKGKQLPGEIVNKLDKQLTVRDYSLPSLRNSFAELSETMIQVVKTGISRPGNLYVQHCPMAFDNTGANWLSTSPEILNPYFGEQMLTCGFVTEEIQ